MPDVESSQIRVPAELADAGPILNQRAAEFVAELDRLKRVLGPLEFTWKGAAREMYRGYQQEWDTAADGLFGPGGILGAIANAMHLNWGNYESVEASNTTTWQH